MSSTISGVSSDSSWATAAALAASTVVSVPPEYLAVSPLSNAPEEEITKGISGAVMESLTPAQIAEMDAWENAQWAATGPAITVTDYDGQKNPDPGLKEGMGEIWTQAPAWGSSITGDTVATLIDTGTTVETFVGTVTAAESAAWNSTESDNVGITATPTVSNVPSVAGGSAFLTVIFAGNGPHTLKANLVTDTTNPDGTVTPVTTAVDIEIPGVTPASTPYTPPESANGTDPIIASLHAPIDAAAASGTAATTAGARQPAASGTPEVTTTTAGLSLSLHSLAVKATPVVAPAYRGPVSLESEGEALYSVGAITDDGATTLFGFYTSSAGIAKSFSAAPGSGFSAQA